MSDRAHLTSLTVSWNTISVNLLTAARSFEEAISKAEATSKIAKEAEDALTKALEEAINNTKARLAKEKWLKS